MTSRSTVAVHSRVFDDDVARRGAADVDGGARGACAAVLGLHGAVRRRFGGRRAAGGGGPQGRTTTRSRGRERRCGRGQIAGPEGRSESADVNAITPSTNDINSTNGWAHVDFTANPGSATLTFVSTRSFYSCFEVRTDGDTSQVLSDNGGANYNTDITDGLYPYWCENNSTETVSIPANGYVEVRMVFGAEHDERFDWTRFDVLPKCTATGFMRDGMDLTAAVINPTDPVTGTVDASTCNIGVYYGPGHIGSVEGAEIYGANYYGLVANAPAVDVSVSSIHDIGETPLNGSQHGIGVHYTTIDQAGASTGPGASGAVRGTDVWSYQKNGIVVTGDGAAVTVMANTVTGEAPVD